MSTGVHHLVAAQAARQPRQEAVVDCDGRSMTYQQLWERSGAVAAALAGFGVGRGDRVAVALDRSLDLVVALLGVARGGAAYVPLDRHAPAHRNSFVLAEIGARVVLCGPDADGWHLADGPVPLDVAALVGTGPAAAEHPVDPEDPLYLAYTSGSTGQPKACVVPHRAVLPLVTRPVYCSLGPGDRVAHLSAPAFDATTFEVWGTLAAGATLVVLPPVIDIMADAWPALVRGHRLNVMFLTTALFDMVSRVRPEAFATLDALLFGGEVVDPRAVHRVLAAGPPRRLVQVYGPTETTTFATYYDCTPDRLAGRERVPIGFPVQDTTVRVLDEQLRAVPPGERGELCIGGPGVGLGYLNRPALTAQRFVPDTTGRPGSRMYRTGDLVRQLHDGSLDFLGRIDRQVKVRGFRIELEEVERALAGTGLVGGAVVEKVGDGLLAQLVAVVTPASAVPDPEAFGDAVASALRERLPSYMIPTRWVVRDSLPLSATGKVDRRQLRSGLG